MKKYLFTIITIIILFTFSSLTYAQPTNNTPLPEEYTKTIIPEVNKDIVKSNSECRILITRFEQIYFFDDNIENDLGSIKRFYSSLGKLKESSKIGNIDFTKATVNDLLGCAIVTGRIKMFYLSIFLSYTLNLLTIIAGSISMLFIIIGGYRYVISALTQSTDEAKKTIINALIGLVVSTSAWIIVNIVLAIISS